MVYNLLDAVQTHVTPIINDHVVSDIAFAKSGTKLIVLGAGFDKLLEFNLEAPYDIANVRSIEESPSSYTPVCEHFFLDESGTHMYLISDLNTGHDIKHCLLTVPFEYLGGYSVQSSIAISGTDIEVSEDGTICWVAELDIITEYSFDTPWDIKLKLLILTVQLLAL